jgi:hypothetical protein
MGVYKLSSQIYLDTITQQYKKIIVINKKPNGELSKYIRMIKNKQLSIFDINTERNNCLYSIINPLNNDFFTIDDITDLFELLIDNGYKIDNTLNKVFHKNNDLDKNFICIISI